MVAAVVVVVVVRAPLLFDARFSEYATVENTGRHSEFEHEGAVKLGAGNRCCPGLAHRSRV